LINRLLSTKQAMIEAGDYLVTIRVRTMLAHAYTQAAQWHQAKLECLEVLTLIEQTGVRTIWSGYVYYNLHITSYAQNRLEEASDWLQRLLRSAQDWQQVELLVRGEICSARLALVRGDLETAHQALHQLEAQVEQEGYAYHAPWVIALRAQCWLAQGDLTRATDWAAQTAFHLDAWNPWRKGEVLMLVRIFLAQRHYAQAVETLSHFREHMNLPGDIKTAIEWMVLQVVALHYAGKREEALRVAARLFALTEPENSIRVYLDAGEPMRQVLLALLSALPDDGPGAAAMPFLGEAISHSYISRLLATFEPEEKRVLRAGAHLARQQHTQPEPPQAEGQRVESLSRQEQRVLRLLVSGLTYAEMAEALIVSPNTVKTQVSSIYRKLGVGRRAEAIAVTARLRLLSPNL
jgi:LuxR family transcriptional regulator, maltose regulon positive regulatory protein